MPSKAKTGAAGSQTPVWEDDKPEKKKTRQWAIMRLTDGNVPFDTDLSVDKLIVLASKVPPRTYHRIRIQERESGTTLAYVRVCGIAWRMLRGEDIIVPNRVVKALENAVEFVYAHVSNRQTGEVDTVATRKQREMYSVLGPATEAEYLESLGSKVSKR